MLLQLMASGSTEHWPWLLLWLAMVSLAAVLLGRYYRYIASWRCLLGLLKPGNYQLFLGLRRWGLWLWHFSVPASCRPRHCYVVGASGFGKSSLLQNLIVQDVLNGLTVVVIDPHGDLVHSIYRLAAHERERVVLIDLEDEEHIQGYNPLQRKPGVLVEEQAAKLILAFKRIWLDSWGPRLEDILRHSLTLLIESGYTLCELERLLTDADFRDMLVGESRQLQSVEFFKYRFEAWNAKERALNSESTLNKVSALVADPRLACRLGSTEGLILADLLKEAKVILVNLGKGKLAGNADLFGALFMADLEMCILSRPQEDRRPVAAYIDEFQNIATESFGVLLTEARKFGLCLTLAHQSLAQLDEKLLAIIAGNIQTQLYFRVSRQDAERLAKEANNIVSQIKAQIQRSTRDKQERQGKPRELSLQEMWEMAYAELTTLPLRECYVTVRGRVDEPQRLRTLDNPSWSDEEATESMAGVTLLEALNELRRRREELEAQIQRHIQGVRSGKKLKPSAVAVAAGGGLDFLDVD